MKDCLIQVCRGDVLHTHFQHSRQGIQGIAGLENVDPDEEARFGIYRKRGEFFFVDKSEVEATVEVLTRENPGKDVKVWRLEAVSVCPAAPMVTKTVTKDGILPA